ncbi:TolC family protein [Acidipila sp. 4G-K13]|uniref:TolC family protein n=2 Tax=Paracidobacterium acidisoli TaxID=2303751 RepID=A0A372ILS6_9BACT|nr:TolC family protein [Paracidobacterium acidisoli]
MNPRRRSLLRRIFFCLVTCLAALLWSQPLLAQNDYTWDQIKARFEAANPTLKADAINVQEVKAEEITANLRPNPQFAFSQDGTQIAPHNGTWTPLSGTYVVPTLSYLHERDHKRELRLQSAQEGTQIASSQHEDLERNLLFNLRLAFIQTLQAKAIVDLAHQELDYYDKIIDISRTRFASGDLAQIDLDRIELQRVQYESDLQAAEVNLRTAKIQLLELLNDKTPVGQFDVQGSFGFSDQLDPLGAFHQIALDNRPDLKAALESIQQANTNHKLAIANGSTDPTFSGWYTWNSSNNNPNATQTLGASISIPLRIFDRNQGEKQRTLLDIDRNQQLADATQTQVFSDVDSAYAQVNSNLILLRPYKNKYLAQALRVRDTVTYAWQHGGASLMDFLNAQSNYRGIQTTYLQLIGSYLMAADQLNLAVGHEVIQ